MASVILDIFKVSYFKEQLDLFLSIIKMIVVHKLPLNAVPTLIEIN